MNIYEGYNNTSYRDLKKKQPWKIARCKRKSDENAHLIAHIRQKALYNYIALLLR